MPTILTGRNFMQVARILLCSNSLHTKDKQYLKLSLLHVITAFKRNIKQVHSLIKYNLTINIRVLYFNIYDVTMLMMIQCFVDY